MIRIATYNINNINHRLPVLLRWLKKTRPDIVCLQELKAEQGKFPEKALQAIGYHALWQGQKTWNGVAILSRSAPIQELRRQLPGDRKDVQSRYLEAIVGQLVIVCIYAPNGNPYPGEKFAYKQKWYKRLAVQTKSLLLHDVPVVITGDFNVMPTEQDVYKPQKYINDALFRREIRAAYSRILQQGWTDVIAHFYPSGHMYTFWDYLRYAWDRNAGLRLDHFLVNDQLTDRVVDSGVNKEVRGWPKASDHAPVWIELKE